METKPIEAMSSLAQSSPALPVSGFGATESGVRAGFAHLYRDHYGFVWRGLQRLGVGPSELEDALQDVFLVLYRRRFDFRGDAELRTWLFSIVRNVAFNQRRGSVRHRRRLDALEAETRDPEIDESRFAALLALRLLDGFLDTLDDQKREAFVLAELEGMSGPEIAGLLNINVNTAYSRVRAARASFERTFADDPELRDQMHDLQLGSRDEVLERARSANDPPPKAAQHSWALLIPQLGAASTGGAAKAGLFAAIASLSTVGQAAVGLVVGSVLAVGVSAVVPSPADEGPTAATVATPSEPEPAKVRTAPDPVATPVTAPARVPAEPNAPAADPVEPEPRVRPKPTAKAAPATARADGLAEVEHLRRAREALLGGDPHAALRQLRDHARRFPNGALAGQRAVSELAALCQLGRDEEATAVGKRFLAAHPSSSFAGHIRRGCVTESAGPGN